MQLFSLNFGGGDKKQSPNPLRILRNKLHLELQSLTSKLSHKHLILCSVVNAVSGNIVATAHHTTLETLQCDMISTLASVGEACKQCSGAMGLTGCSHLKIVGDHRIFSMFRLDNGHVLVFYYKIGVEDLCSPTDSRYKELSRSIANVSDTVQGCVVTINLLLADIATITNN